MTTTKKLKLMTGQSAIYKEKEKLNNLVDINFCYNHFYVLQGINNADQGIM